MPRIVNQNQSISVLAWGPFSQHVVGTIVAVNKDGEETVFNDNFQNSGRFGRFVLPGEWVTEENLPANISFRIDGEEVEAEDITLADPEWESMESLREVDANTDSLESLVTATNAKLDANIAQVTEINAKSPDLRTDFMAGRIRTAGGKISLTQNQTGGFQLVNPAGSGKVFTITNFYLACDMNVDVSFSFDSTLASPTEITPFLPNRAVPAATSAVVRSNTAGMSGGTILSPIYRIPANIPMVQDFAVVLLPGHSVETRIAIGALSNAAFYVAATWAEDPV